MFNYFCAFEREAADEAFNCLPVVAGRALGFFGEAHYFVPQGVIKFEVVVDRFVDPLHRFPPGLTGGFEGGFDHVVAVFALKPQKVFIRGGVRPNLRVKVKAENEVDPCLGDFPGVAGNYRVVGEKWAVPQFEARDVGEVVLAENFREFCRARVIVCGIRVAQQVDPFVKDAVGV